MHEGQIPKHTECDVDDSGYGDEADQDHVHTRESAVAQFSLRARNHGLVKIREEEHGVGGEHSFEIKLH